MIFADRPMVKNSGRTPVRLFHLGMGQDFFNMGLSPAQVGGSRGHVGPSTEAGWLAASKDVGVQIAARSRRR